MSSVLQNLSSQRDRNWHGDIHHDGNNGVCNLDQSQPLIASDLTPTKALCSDNLNYNVTESPLIRDNKISPQVCELTSGAVLNYIRQILLEEDLDDDIRIYPEEAALRDTEKSFYDILGKDYPLDGWIQIHSPQKTNTTESAGSSNTTDSVSRSVMPFYNKGVEDAMNFVPTIGRFHIDPETSTVKFHQDHKNSFCENLRNRCESGAKMNNFNREQGLSGVAPRKQRAIILDEPVRNEKFDEVLLSHGQEYFEDAISLRKMVLTEIQNNSRGEMGELSDKMTLEMMQQEEGFVNFKSLLIDCSCAVSSNDHNMAYELIKKIRRHSTPKGDGYQRLAHYFVDGLEARLVGTGSDIYHNLMLNKGSATELLNTFRIYHAVCPYPRASYFFANETILNVSRDSSKIHIIDFGIDMGFQWPSFFERISSFPSKPKIRITGICFPEKGFHPDKGVQETGRRLMEYAQRFNIHFKYQGIASKWENIKVEDLKLDKEEILVVSSIYAFRKLGDETINMDSARDKVLRLIMEIKPCIFIHGIINASYNNPIFTTRFRNALSSFFLFFDMFDSTMPRDSDGRLLAEKNILSRKAINVIACEGSERVERPETYRQWQARNLRAGFEQLPIDSLIKKKIERTVRGLYNKEFVVDENNKWLLLGWKGSIAYALSTWKPKQ
jgi:GRAS domain family